MDWQIYKQNKLYSLHRAIEKKLADSQILKLLEKINRNPNLVSLSSCSGRIVLLMVDETGKKNAEFFGKWHSPINIEDFEMKLTAYIEDKPLMFRVEPFILHIAASDIEESNSFMKKMRTAGIKRGGIQVISKDKIVMEFTGSGILAVPAACVEEWNDLLILSNSMMKKNQEKIKKLEKIEW
jgi:tRNA wybutosine-synthesizing protein 3